MKMKKGLLMTALITGTVMSSAVAFAEELQEYSLDQMVVTATRTEKKDGSLYNEIAHLKN